MTANNELLLLLQLASTLFMTGLIWFVQLVHYPLMKLADTVQFPAFSAGHQNRTTWVVAGPMLLELATSLGLVLSSTMLRQSLVYQASVFLLIAIWVSTALRQMPLHRQLLLGHNALCIERLVRSNWIRTFAWTLRSVILCWLFSARQLVW
jgi:hypothetical protein